jgi:DMSO/TMAO reductase YedYZ molybdopterin-dependent catalytic subunit
MKAAESKLMMLLTTCLGLQYARIFTALLLGPTLMPIGVGVTFSDFFKKYVQPHEAEQHPITGAVFYGQDGYRTTLLLEDLLRSDVMLADSLDGQPLTIEHGAPLRLVAPAHYGYKNLKHLKRIEFYSTIPKIKRGISAFLDHPRARVLKEERARWIPGWILRYVYRPLISGAVKDFRKAMAEYENK